MHVSGLATVPYLAHEESLSCHQSIKSLKNLFSDVSWSSLDGWVSACLTLVVSLSTFAFSEFVKTLFTSGKGTA